jgi:hypothetical protein
MSTPGLAAAGGSSVEAGEVVGDLRALNAAVTGTQLERAVERASLLIADARARFARGQQLGAAAAAKPGRVSALRLAPAAFGFLTLQAVECRVVHSGGEAPPCQGGRGGARVRHAPEPH